VRLEVGGIEHAGLPNTVVRHHTANAALLAMASCDEWWIGLTVGNQPNSAVSSPFR
jgi:hypothetical protein